MATATTPRKPWTEPAVFACLVKAYPAPAYVLLPQVRNGTGYQRRTTRTADALAVSVWPSRGLYLTGFEIKVSRSDCRKELADPHKSADIQKYCRYWYVVAPKGVIDVGEVPENWGLIECPSAGTVKNIKAAPQLECVPPDMLLLCSILRSVSAATIPLGGLEDEVAKRVAAKQQFDTVHKDRKIHELQYTIEQFEQASGLSLSKSWDAGPIGAAVKFIRDSGVLGARGTVERLQRGIKQAAEVLEHALQGLPADAEEDNQ